MGSNRDGGGPPSFDVAVSSADKHGCQTYPLRARASAGRCPRPGFALTIVLGLSSVGTFVRGSSKLLPPQHFRRLVAMYIDDLIAKHYTHGSLAESISSALREGASDPDTLTSADLAPVDEFHIGGRVATAHFVDQLGLRADSRVLDIGSGIGGASRLVAERFGCQVMGIELTPEYCEVAITLAKSVGLSDRVAYRQGSALEMPFKDGEFSVAYMLHVGMNISDKATLFREVHRVLEPGGTFGVYDILRGAEDAELDFPVPWSTTPDTSFLASIEEMREGLESVGFTIERERHRTAFAREFFQKLRNEATGGPPPLGLHILMGNDFAEKVSNMARNVESGRCTPWELVCRRH